MEESEKPRQTDAPNAELGFALPEPARLSRGRALTFALVGVLALAGWAMEHIADIEASRAAYEDRAG